MYQRYRSPNIITIIFKLGWAGHVKRMGQYLLLRIILDCNYIAMRSRGGATEVKTNEVDLDLTKLGSKNGG